MSASLYADHIRAETTRIIEAVWWVHDRTIKGMNAGEDLRELMAEIRTPPELTLTEEYGKLSWNVRAIWHEYSGWFDSSRGMTELHAVPPSAIAPALAELAGGATKLAGRARAFVESGQPLEALHLLDIALAAEPQAELAAAVKREALTLLDRQIGGGKLGERRWIAAQLRDLDG